MSEFRLTQISDTHLGRRFPGLIANFQALSEHIDTDRPDLVVNTGDVIPNPGKRKQWKNFWELSKPVTMRTMAQAIRRAFGEEPEGAERERTEELLTV